jgi:hypothetical protein
VTSAGMQLPEYWPWQEAKKLFEHPDVVKGEDLEVGPARGSGSWTQRVRPHCNAAMRIAVWKSVQVADGPARVESAGYGRSRRVPVS